MAQPQHHKAEQRKEIWELRDNNFIPDEIIMFIHREQGFEKIEVRKEEVFWLREQHKQKQRPREQLLGERGGRMGLVRAEDR